MRSNLDARFNRKFDEISLGKYLTIRDKNGQKIQITMNNDEELGNHRFVLEEWCSSCSESEDDG